MSAHRLSGSDLREAVFDIIDRELGPGALVRFIAENLSQPGRNYTEERRMHPDESVDEIAARTEKLKKEKGGSLAPLGVEIINGNNQ